MTPLIFNFFKPPSIGSLELVGKFKRLMSKDVGKIGHFGTLDPFACGVLLVGISGAMKANEYIHQMLPKTYLAVGKLGVETITGDLTVAPSNIDSSDYLTHKISKFDKLFIDMTLKEKFLGDYWQVPPIYSATKFEGKALHQWAREGVAIKKDPVKREILDIQVVKYKFPYLAIRVTSSSGTYIRTLFSDCAKHLGTYGTLVSLVREKIGSISYRDSIYSAKLLSFTDKNEIIKYGMRVDEVLKFPSTYLLADNAKKYKNGIPFCLTDRINHINQYTWVYDQDKELIGLGIKKNNSVYVQFNF